MNDWLFVIAFFVVTGTIFFKGGDVLDGRLPDATNATSLEHQRSRKARRAATKEN